MALIKIRGRRDPVEVDYEKAKKIKVMRFGDMQGQGKLDPKEDIDLGDEWAGSVGQIEWVELGKTKEVKNYKLMRKSGVNTVFQVPMSYQLKSGEEFI